MNYWLCVTNSENWEIVKKQNVWGVPKRGRHQIDRVRTGDLLVFYVTPEKICGVFRAVSGPFESDEQIFSWGEFGRPEAFPHRVRLDSVSIPSRPLHFKELIPKLKFVTNKKMWTGHLRRAMRTIPEEDYETIRSLMKK